MKAYFTNLNPREQKLVIAAGFFILLFLPYQFIYAPFQENLLKLEDDTAKAKKNIAWMNSKSQEVRNLKGTGRATTKQSLLTLIETTTKQQKLNKNLHVKNAGQTNIIVTLENVAFDKLMQWLDNMVVTHGLTIQDIKIEKQKGKGIVNARINMSKE